MGELKMVHGGRLHNKSSSVAMNDNKRFSTLCNIHFHKIKKTICTSSPTPFPHHGGCWTAIHVTKVSTGYIW